MINFQCILKSSNIENYLTEIQEQLNTTSKESEISDKKTAIEQALRDVLMKTAIQDLEEVQKIIKLSMNLARQDLVSAIFPVVLLVDVFDVKTLDFCESLFGFVEENVNVFKEPHFFTPCKNSLLRMCNDLLRRLSRSQNTVFCGRILLFLANFFPFSERSGLNVVSEFNVENITEFSNNEANGDDAMGEVDPATSEDSTSQLKIDKHLYLKFWELQEYFRCPYKCYDKEKFNIFSAYSKEILGAFKSFKLDETGTQDEREESHNFFAKFLTNPKLLSLQIGDSNFRRTILVQYLILFQYLVSTVKFKSENDKLSSSQEEWVRETEGTVYKLLNDTPPNGKEFAKSIKHILKREELWNNWKNEGCKEITRPDGHDKKVPEQKKRKLAGDLIKEATKVGKFDLGNAELSHLWNLCPDNLQACKGSDRNFLPPLETYLENKEKSDPTYEWRALRLVSRQSSHFFTLLAPPNEKVEKISDYLKLFNQKIQKDKSEVRAENSGANEISEQAEVLADETENTEVIEDNEDENEHKITKATSEQITEISKSIGDQWRKLGAKLGIEKDVLDFCVSKNEKLPCHHMLSVWFDEDEDGCLENLAYTLEGLEIFDAANLVKKIIGAEEGET